MYGLPKYSESCHKNHKCWLIVKRHKIIKYPHDPYVTFFHFYLFNTLPMFMLSTFMSIENE